jgi:hypothetical protein
LWWLWVAGPDCCAELRDAAGKTGLSMADIIRQSSKLGQVTVERRHDIARKIIQGLAIAGL